MISAISWIPKGVSKSEPVVAEPPSKDEIQQFITSRSQHDDDDDDDAISNNKHSDQVSQALAVADAIGKTPSADKYDDIALALKDLDMEHYDDDEDEGTNY